MRFCKKKKKETQSIVAPDSDCPYFDVNPTNFMAYYPWLKFKKQKNKKFGEED